MDLACVETQIGDGGEADCEVIELKQTTEELVRVHIVPS